MPILCHFIFFVKNALTFLNSGLCRESWNQLPKLDTKEGLDSIQEQIGKRDVLSVGGIVF
jgi:hypothetical protein